MPSIGTNPVSAPFAETPAGFGRRRLLPGDRERQIVEGAVTFFSEHGLEGQLRDLARRLGITHTLLYHYFPTKQALIERVYAEIFAGRWKPEWETLLDDRNLDVETKLTLFYIDYAGVILDSSWVRIFIFSGLSDRYITDRYFSELKENIFPRLVRETRRYRGVPNRGKASDREMELLMGLHGGIFYMGIRRWIYGQLPQNPESSAADKSYVRDRVLAYLLSASAVLGQKQKTSPISQEPL